MENRIQKFLLIAVAAVVLLIALIAIRAYTNTAPASPTSCTSPISPLVTRPSVGDLRTPPIPKPSTGRGVIHGRLVDEAGFPVPDFPIYLATVWQLQTEDGTEDALIMDAAQAPSTKTDRWGYFIFVDIEPGKYGIHYGIPADVGAAYARNEDSQGALLYELASDSTVDVGEIIRRMPQDACP